jgi:hypothetical protein
MSSFLRLIPDYGDLFVFFPVLKLFPNLVEGRGSRTFFLKSANVSFNSCEKTGEDKYSFNSKMNQVHILTVTFIINKF